MIKIILLCTKCGNELDAQWLTGQSPHINKGTLHIDPCEECLKTS